ncbi:MAG: amidase [Candidatus Bathyarchaeota archaeon]|nr:amidase [Candidatus Bathyarchaeota archaeon]
MKTPIHTPISQLSKQLKNGKLSPVQLTETFLTRLETTGPRLNAIVTITRSLALKQARKAEKEITEGIYRGPLHGIPWGAKDLLSTKDIPTTWGAEPYRNRIIPTDATAVAKLREAGAILSAKLAMIEFAGGMGYRQPNACLTGPPRNPWNPDTWTGGSSSGSAAAVAAGLLPFTIGSETWGSILSPANNCGVSGLRPTYGRVSRHGAMALSWTLDKLGPLAQTADDCGTILEAIAGPDPDDPTTIQKPWRYNPRPARRRPHLATLRGAADDANPEVKDNFEKALKTIRGYADVDEIDLPDLPYEAITRTILNAEAASAYEDIVDSDTIRGLTAPEDRWGPYARTALLATDYLRAMRLRGKMVKAAATAMEPYDALAAPSAKKPATPIGEEFRKIAPGATKDIMGAVGNGCGLPAISVPDGFTQSGLPTGIQFMGKPYQENTIIAIARTYQSLTDWHTRHPPRM